MCGPPNYRLNRRSSSPSSQRHDILLASKAQVEHACVRCYVYLFGVIASARAMEAVNMPVNKKTELGVSLPTWQDEHGTMVRWREMRELALLAEEAGIDTVWVPDHLLRRGATSTIGFWECWTLLSALAEATSRVTLGPFMACAGFRNPALLAKMADTLDEVSGGRVILGLGAGVPENDTSWHAFGYATDHVASRYEEALQIVSRLLKEGTVTFQGQYHSVNEAEIYPEDRVRKDRPCG